MLLPASQLFMMVKHSAEHLFTMSCVYRWPALAPHLIDLHSLRRWQLLDVELPEDGLVGVSELDPAAHLIYPSSLAEATA